MPMDVYHAYIINTMYQTQGFSLFFLFYFSADNVKKLEHLDSALQEALTTLFFELIWFPPDSPLKLIQTRTSQTLK